MRLSLPDVCLVLLVGSSGSGKSTFAARHFLPTEVLSSDRYRGFVADDETDQSATKDAFEALQFVAGKRLERRRLTVIDATNVKQGARAALVALAKKHDALCVAIVLDVPEAVCIQRNRDRPDRAFGPNVIERQQRDLRRSLKDLKREGFSSVTILNGLEIDGVVLERRPLYNDRRGDTGPFDIIGDVHGCADELEGLLERLGYAPEKTVPEETAPKKADAPLYAYTYRHPDGRRAVFGGDLVDRGPRSLETVGLVRNMVLAGAALCVPGNHDAKLVRKLRGRKVTVNHGLETTLAELEALPEASREPTGRLVADFLEGLVSHYVFDNGELVIAHAGLPERLQGRASGRVREFALYGDVTGETDALGLPVRGDWAADYRGAARVVYGHTPVAKPQWRHKTINIDTGCVFGGSLTALRYPEMELESVRAARTYAEPSRPFLEGPVPQPQDDLPSLTDVTGRRVITTRLRPNVVIGEAESAAALETLAQTVYPGWLVYLPPTMAAPMTSAKEGLLEHPDEAFSSYLNTGITDLVCEEKHMGSRAVVIVCRDEGAAKARFGVAVTSTGTDAGVVYTRTGRPFFADTGLQTALLAQLRDALTASGFWADFNTDFAVLDSEIMPWSLKAGGLLRGQYAPVAAAAERGLGLGLAALRAAGARGLEVGELLERLRSRQAETSAYADVYRRYVWPVSGVQDVKLAPFQLLASAGAVCSDKPHVWHLETLKRYLGSAPSFTETAFRTVDLNVPESITAATTWWEDLTAAGGEGMVVKPAVPVTFGRRGTKGGPVQPGVKVRGWDYLRLVYGPEYLLPENLERLRPRNVAAKRALALQEFALGTEALERFVGGAPPSEVYACVAAVLALGSERTDPRL